MGGMNEQQLREMVKRADAIQLIMLNWRKYCKDLSSRDQDNYNKFVADYIKEVKDALVGTPFTKRAEYVEQFLKDLRTKSLDPKKGERMLSVRDRAAAVRQINSFLEDTKEYFEAQHAAAVACGNFSDTNTTDPETFA